MYKGYVTVENNSVSFVSTYPWNMRASELASEMTQMDLLKVLEACDGDFSKMDDRTRRAVSIAATQLREKYEEQMERQRECRKRAEERRHQEIMEEIKELTADMPDFSVVEIQMAAAKKGNGFPVRTRQMYTSHLRKEVSNNTVKRIYAPSTGAVINVILRNGRGSTQMLPGIKRISYKFI